MARDRQHPYCYPGTDVYRNRMGIRDASDLEEYERVVSAAMMVTLPEAMPLTTAAYRAAHRHMLGDVYDWAGEYRRVDTGRLERIGDQDLNTPFCRADFIDNQLERRFAKIRATIRPGMSKAEFAATAAGHLNEVNVIHPFLDGNGRTQRQLMVAMGEVAGHAIDLARVEPAAWNRAAILGYHASDDAPLARIVEGCVVARKREVAREAPSEVTILVTRREVSDALAISRGGPTPPDATAVTRLVATAGRGVAFLTFESDGRPSDPGDRLTGTEALSRLEEGFGRGRHRSLRVDPGLVDGPLLAAATRLTASRKVASARAAAVPPRRVGRGETEAGR